MNLKSSRQKLVVCVAAALLLGACERQTLYSRFEHTSTEGWAKDDTISFVYVASVDAVVNEELGLRLRDGYPFTAVTVVVDHTLRRSSPPHLPTSSPFRQWYDTIHAQLVSDEGEVLGRGMHYYQYTFPVTNIRLQQGDTLTVDIRHHMRREVLPGINDVGLTLIRRTETQ